MKIKILDSPMGSGKTTYLIDYMNISFENHQFIYITPFLDEFKRVKENAWLDLKEPKPIKGCKLNGLKDLIFKKQNIISTHALFSRIDSDLIELLKASNYTLILDEVTDVIEELNISKQDIDILFSEKLISVDDTNGKVTWVNQDYLGEFSQLKTLANQNSLFLINGVFMIWCLPIEIFEVFDEVIVSTYQFKYQLQCYYYQYFDVEFEYFHIEKGEMVKTVDNDFDKKFREKVSKLITICENEKLNAIGDSKYNLSKSWYKKATDYELKILKRHLGNFRRNISIGDKYKALVIKSECKDHCYNFLNVLSKEVDYDSSIREFAEFIKGKHIVIGDRVYFSLSERVLACKTLIISYFTIRKIVGIDRKLYALQKELIELLELME